jgi:hypothetical protein
MGASIVAICNKSLGHLGQKPINSITDSNPRAEACLAYFNDARDASLRSHPWNFATAISTMNLMGNGVSIPGWLYLYAYPAKSLNIRKVFEDATSTYPTACEFKEFYLESQNARVIATNITPAYAEFTYQVADTTLYDQAFVDAFSYKLASLIAPSLGVSGKVQDMLNIFNVFISNAQSLNQSEGKSEETKQSSYVEVR